MRKIYLFPMLLSLLSGSMAAQVYIEKQTRHRFAQLNLGADLQASLGGSTSFIDRQGETNSMSLASSYKPRFLIGGTHFWGHADFYIAIPLIKSPYKQNNQEVSYNSGVETVFKYYPWRIEHGKLRPFVGVSFAPFYYEQKNKHLEYGNGPELNHRSFPLLCGITLNHKNHLLETGLMWNYTNKQDYYISRNQAETVHTPPLYFNLSYRYMLETTLSAEKDWESGRTKAVIQILAEKRKLNGFYLGVGPSAAFWTGSSSYNTEEWPFVAKYSTSIFPDVALGYYLHNLDVNIAAAYRGYSSSTSPYGVNQEVRRRSLGIEATKFLFDYQGFAPFLGPILSYEQLSFEESFETRKNPEISASLLGYGLTFGWDIRPNRLQSWILRTNLRWYPNLNLEIIPDMKISFNNLEFNFIQLIVYPDRMF